MDSDLVIFLGVSLFQLLRAFGWSIFGVVWSQFLLRVFLPALSSVFFVRVLSVCGLLLV